MTSTLVVLRHGQSTWNLDNRFTGWTDVDLTEQGEEEARSAGRLMKAEGFVFDVVHTSLLLRAIRTAEIALAEMGLHWLPVVRNWRLNERHYGALQGLNKKETAERHGKTRSTCGGGRTTRHLRRWRSRMSVIRVSIPATASWRPNSSRHECLADVVERMLPYWYDSVVPALRAGSRPLIVAHGNSLRALVKASGWHRRRRDPIAQHPTGRPLVYELTMISGRPARLATWGTRPRSRQPRRRSPSKPGDGSRRRRESGILIALRSGFGS